MAKAVKCDFCGQYFGGDPDDYVFLIKLGHKKIGKMNENFGVDPDELTRGEMCCTCCNKLNDFLKSLRTSKEEQPEGSEEVEDEIPG